MKGKEAPLPVASVPQEKTPLKSALTSQAAALSRETVRFDVEAREKYPVPETVREVEEAYTRYDVEEACKPCTNHGTVVVELVVVP